MSLIIESNREAIGTLGILEKNEKRLGKELQRVSSGMRINSAADDAAGYSISRRMRVQIRSLEQATSNTQNGMNLLRVAQGALSSTTEALRTMKELALNAANDTNTDDDRRALQKEWDESIEQIDDNAAVTYNGKRLLDGTRNFKRKGTWTVLANTRIQPYIRPDGTKVIGDQPLADTKGVGNVDLGIQRDDVARISLIQNAKRYARDFTVQDIPLTDDVIRRIINAFDINGILFGGGAYYTGDTPVFGEDGFGGIVSNPSGEVAAVLKSEDSKKSTAKTRVGPETQWAGVNFAIFDKQGNVRRTATEFFNSWRPVIFGEAPSEDNAFTFQVGARANQGIRAGFGDFTSYGLGLSGFVSNTDPKRITVSISTRDAAMDAVSVADFALARMLDAQTTVGALQSRLEKTAGNLTVQLENTVRAESVLRDVDMAKEVTAYAVENILANAAQAMLAQENKSSAGVLSLLQSA